MTFVNVFQKYSVNEEGVRKPLYSIAWSKPNKRFVAKEIKEEKNYDYLFYILRKIIMRASTKKKVSAKKRSKRTSSFKIAPDDRPDRDEIIENSIKYKRIKL